MFWVGETQVKCVGKRTYEAGLLSTVENFVCVSSNETQTTKIKLSLALEIFINIFFSFRWKMVNTKKMDV